MQKSPEAAKALLSYLSSSEAAAAYIRLVECSRGAEENRSTDRLALSSEAVDVALRRPLFSPRKRAPANRPRGSFRFLASEPLRFLWRIRWLGNYDTFQRRPQMQREMNINNFGFGDSAHRSCGGGNSAPLKGA